MAQPDLLPAPGFGLSYSQDSGTNSFVTALSLSPTIDSPVGPFQVRSQAQKIIITMGPTGTGKSNFIKVATGNEFNDTDNLQSDTQEMRSFLCHDPIGRHDFLLVDTPGFNDTYRQEAEILDQIASWLLKAYQDNKILAGILYFHNITDNRMTNTRIRSLDTFKKICGDEAHHHIRLVTTHWDGVTDDYRSVLEEREDELCRDYWKRFLDKGAETKRFENDHPSAWKIINSLPLDGTVLQIQEEMGKKKLPLSLTKAGRTMVGWLDRAAESIRTVLKRLRILKQSVRVSDEHIRQEFEREEAKRIAILRDVEAQQEYLSRK